MFNIKLRNIRVRVLMKDQVWKNGVSSPSYFFSFLPFSPSPSTSLPLLLLIVSCVFVFCFEDSSFNPISQLLPKWFISRLQALLKVLTDGEMGEGEKYRNPFTFRTEKQAPGVGICSKNINDLVQ